MIIAEDNETQHRPHINQGAQVRSQPLEKPTRIDCDYCPRTFSTKGNLNRHCRQNHSEDQTWHQYQSGPNNSDIARVKLERLDLTRSKIKPDDPIEERRITLLQNVSNKMIYDVADVAETTTSDYSNGAANIRIDSDLTKNIYPCRFGSCKEKTYKTKSHVYEHYSLVHRRDKLARKPDIYQKETNVTLLILMAASVRRFFKMTQLRSDIWELSTGWLRNFCQSLCGWT